MSTSFRNTPHPSEGADATPKDSDLTDKGATSPVGGAGTTAGGAKPRTNGPVRQIRSGDLPAVRVPRKGRNRSK